MLFPEHLLAPLRIGSLLEWVVCLVLVLLNFRVQILDDKISFPLPSVIFCVIVDRDFLSDPTELQIRGGIEDN